MTFKLVLFNDFDSILLSSLKLTAPNFNYFKVKSHDKKICLFHVLLYFDKPSSHWIWLLFLYLVFVHLDASCQRIRYFKIILKQNKITHSVTGYNRNMSRHTASTEQSWEQIKTQSLLECYCNNKMFVVYIFTIVLAVASSQKFIELTHPFDNDHTISWPTSTKFKLNIR